MRFSMELRMLYFSEKKLLKHQVTVEVDLKKFNVPVEFGLKTRIELKNSIFDHKTNLYFHSSKDKTEYTYQLYIHPTFILVKTRNNC